MRALLAFLLLAPLSALAQVITLAPDGSGDYTPDGRSDQVEINQALDIVAATPALTTVYLKGPAIYWIDAPIFISSNTTLTGDASAVIKLVDHARWRTKYMPMIGQKGMSLSLALGNPAQITENITIHGFEIDGNRQNQREPSGQSYYNMIRLQNTRNIRIYDMYMHDNLADIVQVGHDLPRFDINLEFYNNRVHGSGHDGIIVLNAVNFSIHDNIFTDNRTDAHIRVQYSDRFKIYNNIAGNDVDRRFSGGIGVSLQADGNTPVTDAEIYNNFFYGRGAYYGIWLWQLKGGGALDSQQNVYIHNNVITWFKRAAIGIQGFNATRIERNILEGDAGYGEGAGSGITFIGGDPDGTLAGFQTVVRRNTIINMPAFGLDNPQPDIHRFISENNVIFGNLGGPYRNVQSGSDRYNEPAAAGTLAENYYTLLRPGWAAAHESGDFSGDMNARAAWIRYQR